MKKLYFIEKYCILTTVFLLFIFLPHSTVGQTIYNGDTVELSIDNNYRGTIQWQESVNGTVWSNITGGTVNNMIVKPLRNTHYRAVVTELSCDPIYTASRSVVISTDSGIVMTTPLISSNTAISASVQAEVKQLGGIVKITERGVCWSTSANPTVNDSKKIEGNGIGLYTTGISGLMSNTTYFLRSYAVTEAGTILYSELISFRTLELVTIAFVPAHDITTVSAVSGGLIRLNGTETVTARGVCWSTSQNPTTANSKTSDGISDGTFLSSLTNLLPEKIYYLRAYVTASNGITYYSSQISFETLSTYLFTVQTGLVSSITGVSASSGGSVTMTGTGTIAARGVCWSTVAMPTITGNKTTNGTGPGSFTSAITGLIPSTTYYVRAYATSATGRTTYGEQTSFTTNSPFTITTAVPSAITAATAVSGGSITITTPGVSVVSRGICFSTESSPLIHPNRTEDGTGAGNFTSNLSELKPNTKYYIRAYATDNNDKTTYGNEVTFSTQLPLVVNITTTVPSDITLTTATAGGTISTSGPGTITSRGICISTEPSPSLENNKTADGTGTGVFKSSLTNLIAGEKFYVRAYATSNSGVTFYGNEVIFNTLSPISVVTKKAGAIAAISASVDAVTTIIDINRRIKARGICWSTSSNPTISDSKSSDFNFNSSFSSNLTGLSANTVYYARAYVINESDMVYYGNQITFQTEKPLVANILLNAATAVTKNSASVSGTYSSSGMGRVYSLGIAYGTTPNPTYDRASIFVNFGAVFNYNFANLIPATTYYARPYAVTDTGLQYGNTITFKTSGYVSTVTALPASEITSSSARLGINWNVPAGEERRSSNILLSNRPGISLTNYGGYMGSFKPGSLQYTSSSASYSYEGLVAGTTYYVKGSITMQDNTEIYSNEISFTTPVAPVGTLKTNTVSVVSGTVKSNTVSVTGNYSSVGGMSKIGFCLSTNPVPTISDRLSVGTTTNTISIIDGMQYPNVSGYFGELLPSTTYYYRTIAVDINGYLVYGNVLSFTTLPPDQSRTFSVNTPDPTKIDSFTATLGWNVFSPNVAAADYQRGVCYGLKSNPTMSDFTAGALPSSPVTTSPVENLIPNTKYYVRAFAYDPLTKQAYYGNEVTFTAKNARLMSLVLMDPPTEVTNNSVRLQMNAYAEERYLGGGFCFSTSPTPTVTSSKALSVTPIVYYSDAMTYLTTLSGLAVNTNYYVRAFSQHLLDDSYVYSNEVVFKTASLKVETVYNAATGGLNYTTTNRITNYGNETVVQRGIVYAVASDNLPTLASGYFTFEGTGMTDFTAKISLPSYSTRYYIRAYVKTDSGQVIYGNPIDYTTIADPNPPVTTPPVCTGCTNPTPTTPPAVKGPGYLIVGRVLGPATLDCKEGGGIFSDYKAYSTALVTGEFTNASYSIHREDMLTHLKNKFPGEKYEYFVESSYNFSPSAKVAVIIEYKKKIPGWDCYSYLVTVGYGNTESEALAKAVERKNNDINGGKDAKYTKLKTITW